MNTDEVMTRLAKEFKARRSKCKVYDGHVCSWRYDPAATPWVPIPIAGEALTQSLRFTYRNRKIKFFSNSTFVNGSVEGTFACGILSLNGEIRNGYRSNCAGMFRSRASDFPVFTPDGLISPEQRAVLNGTELDSLLGRIALSEGERVLFSNGDISFYLKVPESERVRDVIDRTIDLADATETVETRIDLSSLPEYFHPIVPLIEKWAVSDDGDRDDLLDTTSKKVLRQLVEEVDPYIQKIDAYLDGLKDASQTEAAAALGCLAEVVIEAKQKLAETKESN
jgi:hypothetical protein